MSTDTILILIIIVALLLASFLAAAETSLVRMNRFKAAALVEQNRKHAKRLERLIENPERMLNPILFLILVCHLVAATLIGVLAEQEFGAAGVAVATTLEVVVIFVFAEAMPKTWAVQNADKAALAVAPVVSALTAFPPLRWLTNLLLGISNVILPGKGLRSPYVSEDELLAMADAAHEEGEIENEERALIHSIIEFGDTVVREVMVPRPDMITIDADQSIDEAIEIAMARGFSRVPVLGDGIDDVIGIAYLKDLMRSNREEKGSDKVRSRVRRAHFIPETKPVGELMREMQKEKHHMSIVVDEYGGTSGIVTLEDLIEELVGEIVDEYDREEPSVKKLPSGDILVDARMPVDELGEIIELELPEGDWDTVSGFLVSQLGRMPLEGDSVEFEDRKFIADRVQGRRIMRVRVKQTKADS